MVNLRKEGTYLYIIQISNFVIPLATLPFLTNVLGLGGLGKLGIIQTIFYFIGFLIDFGFTYSASREISISGNDKEQLNKIYTNIQLLRFCIFLIVSIIGILILFFVNITQQEKIAYTIAIISCFSFVIIPNWLFNGISKNSILALFTLIFKLISLVPIFIFVDNNDEYLLVFFIQNSSLIILGLIILLYIHIKEKIKYRLKYLDITYMKENLKEGFNVFSGSALSVVYTTFVPFLIKISLGDKWVGIYILVEKILSILKQMFMPIIQVFYAKICQLYIKNKIQEVKKIVGKILILYLVLTISALLTHTLLGKLFIEIFFDNQQSLFKYIYISIIGQFVVGLSIIVIYGSIIPSGNGYILKKIYAQASLLFLILISIMWNFLTLDLIYYAVIFVELMIVASGFIFMKNKLQRCEV